MKYYAEFLGYPEGVIPVVLVHIGDARVYLSLNSHSRNLLKGAGEAFLKDLADVINKHMDLTKHEK